MYKQFFCYLNFANLRKKESFVSTANRSLIGTSMTIGDVTLSIAIQTKEAGKKGGNRNVGAQYDPSCHVLRSGVSGRIHSMSVLAPFHIIQWNISTFYIFQLWKRMKRIFERSFR